MKNKTKELSLTPEHIREQKRIKYRKSKKDEKVGYLFWFCLFFFELR